MAANVAGTKKMGVDLTSGSIWKGLYLFAIPIVLTNVVQQLYSMVDLMVIGQYAGSTGTVGVSTGGEIADMLTPVATAFSTAGQIYIAQLFGAKMPEKVKETTGTLISVMILAALFFASVTIVFCRELLNLLNCPDVAMDEAVSYMVITALGLPFVYGYNAVCGILRGIGESKRPLFFIIVAAVVNIVLDLVLVAVFDLGAAGTAIATVCAQIGAFLAAFFYMYKRRDIFGFELKFSYFRIRKEPLEVILKLGLPQMGRAVMVRFSMLWLNSSINSFGLVASATNSVGNKIQKFLEVFMLGITTASGAMVGQNLGARRQDRAEKTVWTTFFTCMGIASVLTIFAVMFPREIFGIFTKDPDVLEFGQTYMKIMIIHFYLTGFHSSFLSMVVGSGNTVLNFVQGVMDGIVCRIGFSVLFAYVLGMGAVGMFIGSGICRFIPGTMCCMYFLSGSWKNRKLLMEK